MRHHGGRAGEVSNGNSGQSAADRLIHRVPTAAHGAGILRVTNAEGIIHTGGQRNRAIHGGDHFNQRHICQGPGQPIATQSPAPAFHQTGMCQYFQHLGDSGFGKSGGARKAWRGQHAAFRRVIQARQHHNGVIGQL